MSDDIYHNVLNTEIHGTDRIEATVVIYESGDDFRTHTDYNTNKQQPSLSTGSETVRMRSSRSVTVCLVLLCVLLLTAVIVLCVLINTNNQQCQNKNFTEERDQLITKYTSITEERDELIAKCNNIKLSQQWNEKINGLWTGLYDGWINYKFSLYFISSEKKSWNDSRRYCIDRGADLIIINNKKEQDFVKKRFNTDIFWIGLSDSDEEGRWKWVDNSTLNSNFWDKVLYKEPNGEREENCVVSHILGWADFPCTNTSKWICEKTLF
ncbi:uncharacterized protein [Misgurnus anguillicaudatus]|uniref:uncharacterized protein n=1 Tax=Misgurnus anguillicaudatus TaxID=75329 RepID=UPI003CCF40BD